MATKTPLALGSVLLLALASPSALAQPVDPAVGVAQAYLRSQPSLASLDLAQRTVLKAGSSTVVRFTQRHQGLPVLGAAVAVRVGPDGQVQRAIESAGPVSVSTQPVVSSAAAAARVSTESGVSTGVMSAPTLAVQSDRHLADGGRLVWQITTPTGVGGERFLVDAHQGQLVARQALARDSLGRVYATSTTSSLLEDLPLPGLSLMTPIRLTSTDGQLAVYEYVGGSLRVGLSVKQTVGPTNGNDFLYDPPASSDDPSDPFAAVNGFFHAQRARSFFTTAFALDTSAPAWSLGVVVNVLDHGGPLNNSFFASHGLTERPNVIVLGQGVVDFAYDEDLLTHEFTHYVNHNAVDFNAGVFASDSQGWLTHPAAVDEGVADYFACTLTGDPDFGDTLPKAWQRDLSSAGHRCPDDIRGEPHRDGLVVSSAAWALRQVLTSAQADQLVWGGVATMTQTSSLQDFATGVLDTAASMVASNTLPAGGLDTVRGILDEHGLLDCARELSLDQQSRTTGLLGLDTAARYQGETCSTASFAMTPAFSFVYHPQDSASRIRLHADLSATTGDLLWSLLVRRGAPVTFHPSATGLPEPDAVDIERRDLTGPSVDIDIGDDPAQPLDPSVAYHAVVVHSGCADATLTMTASVLQVASSTPTSPTTTPPTSTPLDDHSAHDPALVASRNATSPGACAVASPGARSARLVGLFALAAVAFVAVRRRGSHRSTRG